MCLNPFLCALHEEMSGIQIGSRNQKRAVISYADDVTILVTKPTEIPKIRDLITQYEETSGARINIHKSRAIALGRRDRNIKPIDILLQDIKILVLTFQNSAMESAKVRWERVTATIRGQAQDAYSRELTFDQ
jgi:hypothetical protein